MVELLEAKPNKMFTEAQRARVRFMRYYASGKPVAMPCAHCGKKKKMLWTYLCSFKVLDFPTRVTPDKGIGFTLKPAPDAKVLPPLTGVCQTHLIAPEMEEVDEHGNTVEAIQAPAAI
jgi:hypothetical protein